MKLIRFIIMSVRNILQRLNIPSREIEELNDLVLGQKDTIVYLTNEVKELRIEIAELKAKVVTIKDDGDS